jgi:hypothetical protein
MNRVHPIESTSRFIRPMLIRSVNIKIDELSKPVLVRQTNEHERLPDDLLNRWWTSTADEKKNIWMEYDASTWG